MRGLKPKRHVAGGAQRQSHLLQMRGLKLTELDLEHLALYVASFTDAWIETEHTRTKDADNRVASFTDAWIETAVMARLKDAGLVASFTDAWIET